jgi:hypothetical protein
MLSVDQVPDPPEELQGNKSISDWADLLLAGQQTAVDYVTKALVDAAMSSPEAAGAQTTAVEDMAQAQELEENVAGAVVIDQPTFMSHPMTSFVNGQNLLAEESTPMPSPMEIPPIPSNSVDEESSDDRKPAVHPRSPAEADLLSSQLSQIPDVVIQFQAQLNEGNEVVTLQVLDMGIQTLVLDVPVNPVEESQDHSGVADVPVQAEAGNDVESEDGEQFPNPGTTTEDVSKLSAATLRKRKCIQAPTDSAAVASADSLAPIAGLALTRGRRSTKLPEKFIPDTPAAKPIRPPKKSKTPSCQTHDDHLESKAKPAPTPAPSTTEPDGMHTESSQEDTD